MNSEIYNDNVKITTYPAILRQSLLMLCCTSCRNFSMCMCTPTCVHVLSYIQLQMTDKQNTNDVKMIAADLSLT